MNSWRDSILAKFAPGRARITIAEDPDNLLREARLSAALAERGFSLLVYEDPVEFRFTYESGFRDRGEAELVISHQPNREDGVEVPWDVKCGAHEVALGLRELFPKLCHAVVAALDLDQFDRLHAAHERILTAEPIQGERRSIEFVSQHVFKIVPSLIDTPADLIRLLTRKHRSVAKCPGVIDEWLISELRQNSQLDPFPLNQLVTDAAVYWAFLQTEWTEFIRSRAPIVREFAPEVAAIREWMKAAFIDNEVRSLLPMLFDEGHLTPVAAPASANLPHWLQRGIHAEESSDVVHRERLHSILGDLDVPTSDDKADTWAEFALRWGLVRFLWLSLPSPKQTEFIPRIEVAQATIDAGFWAWLQADYAGLYNYPAGRRPKMVHQIPAFLDAKRREGTAKIALIVMDGLAIEQWHAIREKLAESGTRVAVSESATCAWIPSLTNISRQALYSGRIPKAFEDSISRTDLDGKHWRQFWEDRGVRRGRAEHFQLKGISREELNPVQEAFSNHDILGITVEMVDTIVHRTRQTSDGVIAQVEHWFQSGFFSELLERLLNEGYHVTLTADHGNAGGQGSGSIRDGVIPDYGGKRCRIYRDERLCQEARAEAGNGDVWKHRGLPDQWHTLVAARNKIFFREAEPAVSHGGASIEEVIVPLIEFHG